MTDALLEKKHGTNGTSGTTLIGKGKSGPVADGESGANGTAMAATRREASAVVPLVPLRGKRTGPENASIFRAVPLVSLVPPENGRGASLLVPTAKNIVTIDPVDFCKTNAWLNRKASSVSIDSKSYWVGINAFGLR